MNKLAKGMIYISCICLLFLVGCSNKVSVTETQTNTESKEETSQSNTENSSDKANKGDDVSSENETEIIIKSSYDDLNKEQDINSSLDERNTESTKQIYLNKLNELDANLKETLEERYASSKTLDMIEAANEEYNQWDYMLNEVYSILEEQLSQEDMDKLREEEINWIKDKELKSKEEADKYKGGSIEPFMELTSLIDSTRKRCYELVNQYIK